MSNIVDEIALVAETDPIDFNQLEELFEAARPDGRIEAIRTFTPDIQQRLFEQADGRGVTLEQMVPSDVAPLEEVIHEGQNTLPAFRSFQKRFCRPPDDENVVWGYNEQTFRAITGPGYFVAYPDDDTDELHIDYRELPTDKPDDWPEIVPNKARLGRFVYADTVDRLRRVTDRVTVGRAFVENSDPMNAWFVLCRAHD